MQVPNGPEKTGKSHGLFGSAAGFLGQHKSGMIQCGFLARKFDLRRQLCVILGPKDRI